MKSIIQTPPDPSRAHVMHAGDGIATGTIENVYVVVWRDSMNATRAAIERHGLLYAVQKHRGRTAILCVIEPTSKPPDEEMKRASLDMLKESESDLIAIAAVVEGEGFRAAMIRAVLSAIQMLVGRHPYAVRYFADTASASAWLADVFTRATRDALVETVEELRAQIDDSGQHAFDTRLNA